MVTDGLANPTAMAFAPDGRLFITEQGGRVRVVQNGVLRPEPVIELTVDSQAERGICGIAIDPQFQNTNLIYLYYAVPGDPGHNRVSRFTLNGNAVVSGSEQVLLDIDPVVYGQFHNGGAMHFGPDGKLYVAVGDHLWAVSAQDPDSPWGKLLRMNPDGTIPTDNPFPTGSNARRLTWAMGLRNPFTFTFQPTTGRLFVNDVGNVSWEEINDATQPGQNFGWPEVEGPADNPAFVQPVYAYGHADAGDGLGCAITGGAFFNPATTNYPTEWTGRYFYVDYCNWWINYLDLSGPTAVRGSFATDIPASPLGLLVSPGGDLMYLSRDLGKLYRVVYNAGQAPVVTAQPVSVSAFEGQSATFGVSVAGASPLTYKWQFNGDDVVGANGPTYTIPAVSSATVGGYRVIVSNDYGSDTSQTATLISRGFNARPVARILTPANHIRYQAGTTIAFSGTATDAEDGSLPPSAFSWQLYFHHDEHRHGGPPILTGASAGTVTIPSQGETSPNVWYRIILTVTDSKGLTAQDSVDLDPTLAVLTLATNPPGLEIRLDGVPHVGLFSQSLVAGMLTQLSTLPMQQLDTTWYQFSHWSPALPAGAFVTMPATSVTYTASFSVLPGGPRPLRLLQPLYDCQTGQLTFQTAGGDGTPIEFMALGVTWWTSNPIHVLGLGLRTDGDSIVLNARQGGVAVSRPFAFKAYCQNRPPVLQNAQHLITTVTAGKAFSYVIPANTFSDPDNHSLTVSMSNLHQGVAFDAVTRMLSGTVQSETILTLRIEATDVFEASVQSSLFLIVAAPLVNDCFGRAVGPEIISVQNGPWNNPQTWSCYCVPASCNTVRVSHLVSIGFNNLAEIRKITFTSGGKLVMGATGGLKIGN